MVYDILHTFYQWSFPPGDGIEGIQGGSATENQPKSQQILRYAYPYISGINMRSIVYRFPSNGPKTKLPLTTGITLQTIKQVQSRRMYVPKVKKQKKKSKQNKQDCYFLFTIKCNSYSSSVLVPSPFLQSKHKKQAAT